MALVPDRGVDQSRGFWEPPLTRVFQVTLSLTEWIIQQPDVFSSGIARENCMGTGVRKPLRSVQYSRRKFASMKSCSLSPVRYSKGSAIARSGIARVDCTPIRHGAGVRTGTVTSMFAIRQWRYPGWHKIPCLWVLFSDGSTPQAPFLLFPRWRSYLNRIRLVATIQRWSHTSSSIFAFSSRLFFLNLLYWLLLFFHCPTHPSAFPPWQTPYIFRPNHTPVC